ncbi:uncharacterized protein LOC128873216 isoform X2 [Hylaeus volcanicus]|uniref:uncharacterized protein LOC128873216 isoform X2 n=1 Tax=Hylaeus volcanicus TaxID=313075 RepID=UPI0023B7D92F|nr:uncharacterized protein LOC128873216 isoform X2 [Hylaeus volcanicus]
MYRLSNLDDVLRNEHYENDIRYAFQLCLWILKPIGIYPFIYSRANRLERMVSVVLISICCLVVQFVIVPFGYYILFYEKDMNTRIKFLGPLAFCVTSFFKYGYLSLKGRAFERCIVHVERDWRLLRDQDHRAIMIRHVTMSRNLITLCAAFMYTGGLSYHTIMPLLSKNVVNENVTIRPLTYPGYEAFFDIQESPTYEIVYCMHCIYVLVIGNITMAAYSLTAVFTSHACGQIEIQTSRLEHLTNEKRSPRKYASYENHIAIVVRNHVKILRFTKDVEKAMQEILLMEVVMSTLLICLLEYYCMMPCLLGMGNQRFDCDTNVRYSVDFLHLQHCDILLRGRTSSWTEVSTFNHWHNRHESCIRVTKLQRLPTKSTGIIYLEGQHVVSFWCSLYPNIHLS